MFLTLDRPVDIYEQKAIVGSNNERAVGATYIYENIGGIWNLLHHYNKSDVLVAAFYGWDVAVNQGNFLTTGLYIGEEFADNRGGLFNLTYDNNLPGIESECVFVPPIPTATDDCKTVEGTRDYCQQLVTGSNTITWTYNGNNTQSIIQTQEVIINDQTRPVPDVEFGWKEEHVITNSESGNNGFSSSMAFDNNIGIIGASSANQNKGSAYIYNKSGNTWQEGALLEHVDGESGDNFGYACDISGDYAIVGAPRVENINSNVGVAYIYFNDGNSWSQQAVLNGSTNFSARFGWDVAIEGEYAFVGAFGDDTNAFQSGMGICL